MSKPIRASDPRASNASGFGSMAIEQRRIVDLRPYERNPRVHSERQIGQIADSIERFGFNNPVLIDASGGIIAGHGRVEAAKLLGFDHVPTLCIEHLSEAQKRAYILADNRLAEKAGWDDELLAIELQYLVEIDTDFEVEITGFETAEIDALVGSLGSPDDAAEDEVPPINDQSPAITRPGDLWLMGKHRLLCGNALDPESYAGLLSGERVRMVFTDPPWNVPVNGHVCGSGRIKHREFAMATGEMSEDEFTEFLERVLTNLASHCVDGAILDVCMDWRHIGELLTASRRAGLQYLNLCVWNKDNGGMGSFYRSKHELIGIFKIGAAQHINNIQLGRFGRYRTNVWDYAGVNTLREGRLEDLSMHPTVKPVALVADAIKDCTRRGDIVLDAFMGSGTTVIAAERTGRIAYGLELDPLYVDTAVRRWEAYTGGHAIHECTGMKFGEVAGSHEARASMLRRVRHRSRTSLGSGGAE